MFTDNATGICLGPHTASYSGFRADNTNTQQYGKSALSYFVWDSVLGNKKVFEMLATTITAYIGLYASTPTSNTNNTQVITSAYGNTYFPQLTASNTFTSSSTFVTPTIDDLPVFIQYDDNINPATDIRLYPNVSASTGNPYTLAGDCCIVGSADTVIGKYDRFNAIRFTDNDITAYANTQLNMIVNNASVFSISGVS